MEYNKAEQRAFEAYPPKYAKQERHLKMVQSEKVDTHQPMRTIYIKGYQQAEKDLALTIDDVKTIDRLLNRCVDCSNPYQEVLDRFNNLKGK